MRSSALLCIVTLKKYEKNLKNQQKMIALDIQMWYSIYRSQSGLAEVELALEIVSLVGNDVNYYQE